MYLKRLEERSSEITLSDAKTWSIAATPFGGPVGDVRIRDKIEIIRVSDFNM
jgi:hypothetical protein